MKVLIVEDEALAADRLESLIHKHDPDITITDRLDTVKDSVSYLQENLNDLDLIFMDIQLADGKSLEIFRKVDIQKPVIFTTAYDEYSLEAFKVNSVDYLLKPIKYKELSFAIDKYTRFHTPSDNPVISSEDLLRILDKNQGRYKSRFLLKYGNRLVSEKPESIGLFFIEDKLVYSKLFNHDKKFLVDHSLDDLIHNLLDPNIFFRVNRSTIININAISSIAPFKNHRLKIFSNPGIPEGIIVSRERVNSFRNWLDT